MLEWPREECGVAPVQVMNVRSDKPAQFSLKLAGLKLASFKRVNAKVAMRAGAILASISLLALAAPAIMERAETQRANQDWRERAESFVSAFGLNERADEQRLGQPEDERLWRLARAYGGGVGGALEAIAHDRDAIGVYQTFATAHFDQAQRQARELGCLAQTIYYEARSESRQGQMAVAEVVLNRVRHPLYPDTICDVVYQGSERNTGCQFTFTCDGSMRRTPRGAAWASAERLAAHAMLGFESGTNIGGATHYHTVAVQPVWSETLVRTGAIGSHIFYRYPGAAGRLPMPDGGRETPA